MEERERERETRATNEQLTFLLRGKREERRRIRSLYTRQASLVEGWRRPEREREKERWIERDREKETKRRWKDERREEVDI